MARAKDDLGDRMDAWIGNLILASASPRRQELLRLAGIPFTIIPAMGDELVPEGLDPQEISYYLAEQKAEEVAKEHPDSIVIGCDTTVLLGEKVLGKPRDEEEAVAMLESLSGKTHQVVTGVCVIGPKGKEGFSEMTSVQFYPLSRQEIEDYVATENTLDKAGAYGIQGKAAVFVQGIQGDYYNVVGLPVARLCRLLRRMVAETEGGKHGQDDSL